MRINVNSARPVSGENLEATISEISQQPNKDAIFVTLTIGSGEHEGKEVQSRIGFENQKQMSFAMPFLAALGILDEHADDDGDDVEIDWNEYLDAEVVVDVRYKAPYYNVTYKTATEDNGLE